MENQILGGAGLWFLTFPPKNTWLMMSSLFLHFARSMQLQRSDFEDHVKTVTWIRTLSFNWRGTSSNLCSLVTQIQRFNPQSFLVKLGRSLMQRMRQCWLLPTSHKMSKTSFQRGEGDGHSLHQPIVQPTPAFHGER